jgi:hypothetical protein
LLKFWRLQVHADETIPEFGVGVKEKDGDGESNYDISYEHV